MPRKIDWELKGRRQLVNKQLYKQNAIVNAIRSGNIAKAEILSRQELVPRNPIQEALLRKQAEKAVMDEKERRKSSRDIIDRLQAILDKPDFDYNKFTNALRRVLFEGDRQTAIDAPLPESDEEIIIEEASDEYVHYPEEKPYEVSIGRNKFVKYKIYDKDNIDKFNSIEKVEEYLNDLLEDQRKYFERLSRGNRGQWLIKDQTEHQRNKENYSQYINYIKQHLIKLKKSQTGYGIMTNLSDLKERIQLIIGSMEAGNTSKELKNELSEISHYLYKNGLINKSIYENLINLTN